MKSGQMVRLDALPVRSLYKDYQVFDLKEDGIRKIGAEAYHRLSKNGSAFVLTLFWTTGTGPREWLEDLGISTAGKLGKLP